MSECNVGKLTFVVRGGPVVTLPDEEVIEFFKFVDKEQPTYEVKDKRGNVLFTLLFGQTKSIKNENTA